MSYPPQGYGPQGYQPYGQPPPGYGPYGYGRPSTAPAYITAILFVVVGVLSLVTAIIGWDGTSDNVHMIAALVGLAFSEDLTGNIDFAIAATMTAACSALTFGLLMFFRLEFIRWILAVLGGLVTVYYIYAVIKLLSDGAGEYVAMPLVTWLLWLGGTVLAVLPATGRAMRRRGSSHYPPQQGYPPQQTGYPQPPGYPQQY